MPKWFSTAEKELIGQRLLEQGYRLFSTYGLKKTNVEELASAVGISKGAFYNFYESKEDLFMDVVEQAEARARQEILKLIDLPGPTPRARLTNILKKAFTVLTEMPILRFFNTSDFDLLMRRLPPEKLQQHLGADLAFFNELVERCRAAGIPIRAPVDQIAALIYPLVPSGLAQDAFGQSTFPASLDMLLELIAAFCLGEVELENKN